MQLFCGRVDRDCILSKTISLLLKPPAPVPCILHHDGRQGSLLHFFIAAYYNRETVCSVASFFVSSLYVPLPSLHFCFLLISHSRPPSSAHIIHLFIHRVRPGDLRPPFRGRFARSYTSPEAREWCPLVSLLYVPFPSICCSFPFHFDIIQSPSSFQPQRTCYTCISYLSYPPRLPLLCAVAALPGPGDGCRYLQIYYRLAPRPTERSGGWGHLYMYAYVCWFFNTYAVPFPSFHPHT
jgi:hypothetical protein